MVGGAVSFASEGQRLSRTSRDSLRAVAVEDQTAASEEAHRTGISRGGRAADDGLARDDLDPEDFDSALASYDLVLVNFYALSLSLSLTLTLTLTLTRSTSTRRGARTASRLRG